MGETNCLQKKLNNNQFLSINYIDGRLWLNSQAVAHFSCAEAATQLTNRKWFFDHSWKIMLGLRRLGWFRICPKAKTLKRCLVVLKKGQMTNTTKRGIICYLNKLKDIRIITDLIKTDLLHCHIHRSNTTRYHSLFATVLFGVTCTFKQKVSKVLHL